MDDTTADLYNLCIRTPRTLCQSMDNTTYTLYDLWISSQMINDMYVLCIAPQMFCIVYGQHHRHFAWSMDNTTHCTVYGQHHRHTVRSMNNTVPQTLCTVYVQHYRDTARSINNTTETLYGLWTTLQILCTVYEQHHRHCTVYGQHHRHFVGSMDNTTDTTDTLYGQWTTPCHRHCVRSMATPQTHCTVYGNTTDTLYGLWQHHKHTVRSMDNTTDAPRAQSVGTKSTWQTPVQ